MYKIQILVCRLLTGQWDIRIATSYVTVDVVSQNKNARIENFQISSVQETREIIATCEEEFLKMSVLFTHSKFIYIRYAK